MRCSNVVVIPGMIEAKIKGLKDNKSPGADGISPRLLKEIVDDIGVPHLTYQYRMVSYQGSGKMLI